MMNLLRPVVAFVVAIATVVIPGRATAQGNPDLPKDCRRASRILRTGHPAPHREWAWSVISSCPDSAAAVLATTWNAPTEGDLARLWAVSHRMRDARLTHAVLNAFRDPTRSRAVRIAAARVLGTHAAPNLVLRDLDLPAIRGDSVRISYIRVDHPDVRQGAVPITPALVAEIRDALAAVSQDDPDGEVRSVARAVARQIRIHVRS